MFSLGRGLGVSLLRDAPFSAIYWSFIELFKSQARSIFPERSYKQDLGISFVSGSLSGVVSTVFLNNSIDCRRFYSSI